MHLIKLFDQLYCYFPINFFFRDDLIFWLIYRGGNLAGQVGFGFGSDGSVNLHVVFFQIFDRFRLDWRSFDFGSGQVGSCPGQVESIWLFKKIKSDWVQIRMDFSSRVRFWYSDCCYGHVRTNKWIIRR
jgi:hypothetical protein